MTKKVSELRKRHFDILDEMAQIDEGANKREAGNRKFTPEETEKWNVLEREIKRVDLELEGMVTDQALQKELRENRDKNVLLREYIAGVKEKRESNTLTLAPKGTPDGSSIKESGAVELYINDLIDTQVEGIGLPPGLNILTGVVGDVLWPLSTDDAVASVAGEVAQIDEQALKFANQKATSERVAVAIAVSNKAIDNAAFDLVNFVAIKIRKAIAIMLAKRIYSHAAWNDAFKGPFSLVTAATITKGNTFAKQIALAVAGIADLGFEGKPLIVIDKVTEAELKYTPANDFGGNTKAVIEDGKLAGYDYVTSGHIDGKLNKDGEYVKETDRYVGIGFFDYLAVQQHGDVRFGIDNQSAAVQGRDSTVFTLNTDMSMTELSQKINGNTSGKPQAFALLKIVEPTPSNGN